MSDQILSKKALQALVEYLQDHESSIADGENDFGELREIYEELFHKKPEGLKNMLDQKELKAGDVIIRLRPQKDLPTIKSKKALASSFKETQHFFEINDRNKTFIAGY